MDQQYREHCEVLTKQLCIKDDVIATQEIDHEREICKLYAGFAMALWPTEEGI